MDLTMLFCDIEQCPLYTKDDPIVPPEIVPDAPLLIVGEAPGASEVEAGRPFVGRSGRFLRTALREAGIESYSITNVLKHRPPENEIARAGSALYYCPERFLWREIAFLEPKIILALGATAGGLWFPRMWNAARVLPNGTIVVVTYHPAYILRRGERSEEAAAFRKALAFVKEVYHT